MEAMKLEVVAEGRDGSAGSPKHYAIINEHGHILTDTLNCHHTIEPEEQRKFLEKLVSCYSTCTTLTVPPDAERFDPVAWVKWVDAPSVLAPGAIQQKPKLTCPRCGEGHAPQRLSDAIDCSCGVRMLHGGVVLYVWTAPRAPFKVVG